MWEVISFEKSYLPVAYRRSAGGIYLIMQGKAKKVQRNQDYDDNCCDGDPIRRQ